MICIVSLAEQSGFNSCTYHPCDPICNLFLVGWIKERECVDLFGDHRHTLSQSLIEHEV